MSRLKDLRTIGLAGLLAVATVAATPKIYALGSHTTPYSTPAKSRRVIEITKNTFDKEVLKSPLPVMVDFYHPACGPCMKMKPSVEKMAKKYAGKVKVGAYDKSKDRTIPNKYQVHGLPHLLFFNKGKLVSRSKGFKTEKELDTLIREFLKKTKK